MEPPHTASPPTTMKESIPEEPFIAIIGAGFGGIIAGICLKEKLNFHNFSIYEKDSDIGGTWRDNRYPGARCDVLSHFYSLSTDLKSDWEDKCATQSSILGYMKDVIQKHRLGPHIKLNTEILSANWTGQQTYQLKIQSTTGVSDQKANVIISAAGVLHIPKMPVIKGLDTFDGKLFHSARWDESINLSGKRVAVIGSGCTAAQIMAEIPNTKDIKVVQFGRTPSWIFPIDQGKVSNLTKWILNSIPLANRLMRWRIFWLINERNFHLIFGPFGLQALLRKRSAALMKKAAPQKYHEVLIPNFPVGSRRLIINDSHLRALHLPNVEYKHEAIEEITADGIITSKGEKVPVDVIICATGFVVDKYPIDVFGRDGITIQGYYDKTGGPNAHLGMTVPGFPNFAMLSGPNTATGFTSVLFFEEAQMDYIRQLVKPILDGRTASFEVKQDVNDKFNREIQERLARSVHISNSWYRVNGVGKNIAIWPGSGLEYWRNVRKVNWLDFDVRNNEGAFVRLSNGFGWMSTTVSVVLVAGLSMLIQARVLSK
ncbi:hypothetical protein CPB83DRAFT_879810 [Crepidotus variabilis]|uniref:Flavin-containing monooxygenase n=1 Tax=Crepidotus variabilis TaxID=179855 RepID=A0A9P6ERV2_9AGAR|nr:hypothetical protein CPB83DRAFT_879810 [Crepidotus variabilis]